MKKIFLLSITIIIAFVGFAGYFLFLDKDFYTNLHDISGDNHVMDGITWKGYNYSNYDEYQVQLTSNKARIAIRDEGITSSQEDDVGVAYKQYYEHKEDDIISSMIYVDTCDYTNEDKENLNIRYALTFANATANEIYFLNTNLVGHSNEVYTLQKKTSSCQYKGGVPQYQYVEMYNQVDASENLHYMDISSSLDENNNYVSQGVPPVFLKKDDTTYYVMPITDEYTQGMVQVYQLTLHQKESNRYGRIDTIDFITLPENRIYEDMKIIDDNFVILSHTDTNLYINIYEKDGQSKREVVIPYVQRDENRKLRVYVNDDCYLLYDSEEVYVIDMKQGELKERIPLTLNGEINREDTTLYYTDLLYKNDMLYVATAHDKYVETFLVYKNQELVYEGELNMHVYDALITLNTYYEGYFIREE